VREYHNATELRLVEEVNRLRRDPQSYIAELKSRRAELVGSTMWTKFGGLRLVEGAPALDSAISDLEEYARTSNASGLLLASAGLALAAQDLVLDVAPKGLITQRGTDESTVVERANRYGTWVDFVQEIAIFGVKEPVEIVCQALISDAVPSRVNRKALLNSAVSSIGVCVAPHASTSAVAVLLFAGGYDSKRHEDLIRARDLAAVAKPDGRCTYCFSPVEQRRSVFGLGGHQYHKNCFMCKACKGTLRHVFYESEGEPYCKDCVLFRRGKRCDRCGQRITDAVEQYLKDGAALCEGCFLDEAVFLTEGYSHSDSIHGPIQRVRLEEV
jgi:hypothetical protein